MAVREIETTISWESLRELLVDSDAPQGFYTTREWASHLGFGLEKVRRILRAAISQGKASHCKVIRENIQGIMQLVSAYKFDLGE